MFDQESQSFFVTQRDAHTWVEVYFPEYGWIEFEPTAGESPLERPETGEDEMSVTSQQEEPQPESPLAPTPPAPRNPEDLPPQFTGEELLPQGGEAAGTSLPWWVWALALLLVLPAGGFLIWRARSSGPTAFSADLPLLLYERFQHWAERLGIGPAAHQTPYEHTRQLVTALPETQPYIEPLAEEYVRYRFARQDVPAPAAAGGQAAADPDLLQQWQAVEPLFWKAWLRKLRDRVIRPKNNVYQLTHDDRTLD
jgi:hypothetical protein